MMLIRKWKKPRSLSITKQEMNDYVSRNEFNKSLN